MIILGKAKLVIKGKFLSKIHEIELSLQEENSLQLFRTRNRFKTYSIIKTLPHKLILNFIIFFLQVRKGQFILQKERQSSKLQYNTIKFNESISQFYYSNFSL
ncbi:hypothetical protein pb186bvf_008002 [Paramecium bursaria]